MYLSPESVCYNASGDELIFPNLHLFHKKYCKISLVHCFHTCSSANVSFFHIQYQYSLSTQQDRGHVWGRNQVRGGEKEDQAARSYCCDLFLTKQQQRMKNVWLSPPSPHAINTGQFSAMLSRAFPYSVAFRWKSSAFYCQSFISEQCQSSYSHTAFQLWQQDSIYGLIQYIIRSLSQRGKNSLQQFCTNKQQKFLKLFSRFLMWHCVSSLCMSHVQLPKQELCRDVKDAWKAEQVGKELAEDWFYLSISISTWRAVVPLPTNRGMDVSLSCTL